MELPGFIDEFTKKWSGQPTSDIIENDDDDSLTNIPEPPKPNLIPQDMSPIVRQETLPAELLLLVSGLKFTLINAKNAYELCKFEGEKTKLFTALLNELSANMDDNGNCDLNNPKIQELFQKTAPYDVRVSKSKTQLTKRELDAVKHKLDGLISDCQHEIKLKSHNLQKCENDHRTFIQEVKSLFDKYFDIIRKFLQGLTSRG